MPNRTDAQRAAQRAAVAGRKASALMAKLRAARAFLEQHGYTVTQPQEKS